MAQSAEDVGFASLMPLLLHSQMVVNAQLAWCLLTQMFLGHASVRGVQLSMDSYLQNTVQTAK
jgi:hypothetical protein